MSKGWTPENMAQARGFFERALVLDPGNVDALVGIAFVDALYAGTFFIGDYMALATAAEAALTKALSLAPNNAWAHMVLGFVQLYTNRATQGIAECERALALDRNLAAAQGFIGLGKYFIGRAEETEAHVQEALRLSPRDTNAYTWMSIAGCAKCYLGADEEAVAWLRRAVETNRNFPLAHFYLAAALAQLGKLDEARAAATAGIALNPGFTIRRFRTGVSSDSPIFLAQRERICDSMRKAGVPEE